ncbi:MAG: HDOD domain-containing protein [Myxococcota bacterium]
MATELASEIDERLWFGLDDEASSDEEAKASLAAEVARVSGLKPFPTVASKVLAELSSDEFSTARVANLVESDPALASLTLRLVNSALHARGAACQEVGQAVVRLGATKLRDLVVSAATLQMFHDVKGFGITVRDHCAITAAIVRVLGQTFELQGADAMYIAGLLHDVGKLLLLETREFNYAQLKPDHIASADGVHVLERKALGYDHAVLGGLVIRAWQIPDPIPQIVAWHHQPMRAYNESGPIGPQVAVLRIANRIAWYLAQTTMPSEELNAELAASTDGQWIGLQREHIATLWVRLVEARGDALSAFSA